MSELPDADEADQRQEESFVNVALLDRHRWGWTAAGRIADLLPPHERARRKSSKKVYLRNLKRKRDSEGSGAKLPAPSIRLKDPPGQQVETTQQPASEVATASADCELKPAAQQAGAATERNLQRRSSADLNQSVGATSRSDLRFHALNQSGKLDIYTYHRGREGIELRDERTGELLCDVNRTDTSFGKDEPNLCAQVTVKFPLEDVDGETSTDAAARRHYKETIQWDLSDPESLTPIAFAAELAESFGLSYRQTLDVADSIRTQLHNFVRDHCAYDPPVTTQELSCRDLPPSVIPELYGDVNCLDPGTAQSGHAQPCSSKRNKAHGSKAAALARAQARATGDKGRNKTEKGKKVSTKRKRDSKGSALEQPVVEEIYRQEVQKRLREESTRNLRDASEATGGIAGEVRIREGPEALACFKCHQTRDWSVTFACGIDSHSCCYEHFQQYRMADESRDSLIMSYCPICSLTCSSATCSRVLDAVAYDFKQKCLEQNAQPSVALFHDLFSHAQTVASEFSSKESEYKKKKRKRLSDGLMQSDRWVPKVPAAEFPREIRDGVDIDPGTEIDYRTVFGPNGGYVLAESPNPNHAPIVSTSGFVEDGSVDFCNICRKHGNLLCCDFCPRAFHSTCIQLSPSQASMSTQWECPACAAEKHGLASELLDGSKSLSKVLDAYRKSGKSEVSKEVVARLKPLGIIHEMLEYLMSYDFGYMFRAPVDVKAIVNYTEIVKKPMDLGTMAKKIIRGKYFEDGDSIADALVSVLSDLELVWHNCFLFNVPGSSVFRMAEVQSRAAKRVREKSLDSLLSDEVKERVLRFRSECEESREPKGPDSSGRPTGGSLVDDTPSKAKLHKIMAPKTKHPHSRSVGVLDPETGLLVKIYTSVQAACAAMELFQNLNHPCERDMRVKDMYPKVRQVIKDSAEDPNYLIFGYRWLLLHELKGGEVIFGTDPPESNEAPTLAQVQVSLSATVELPPGYLVEMVLDDTPYFFKSVEQSVSYLGSADWTLVDSRKLLCALQKTDEVVAVGPRKFRRVQIPDDAVEDPWKRIGVKIQKVDLLSGASLVGLCSMEAAYQDWLRTMETSPLSSLDCSRTPDVFTAEFLDGQQSVDGIAWRRISGSDPVPTTSGNTDTTSPQDVICETKNGCHPEPARSSPVLKQNVEPKNGVPAAAAADVKQRKLVLQVVPKNGVSGADSPSPTTSVA